MHTKSIIEMIMKYIYSMILALTVIACTKQDNSINEFSFKVKSLSYSKQSIPNDLLDIQEIFINESNLICVDGVEPFLHCYDLDSLSYIKGFGKKGKGSGEFNFLMGESIGVFDSVTYILDLVSLKLYDNLFDLHNYDKYIIPFDLNPLQSLNFLNDSTCVVTSSNKEACFFYMNYKNRTYEIGGQIPKEIKTYKSKYKNSFNELSSNAVTTNTTTKKIAVAYSYFPMLQIYQNDDLQYEGKLKDASKQRFESDAHGFTTDETYSYYTDITSNGKYIVALCIKNTIGIMMESSISLNPKDIITYLHVWDWNGNALWEIPVKMPLTHIAVDDQDRIFMVNPYDSSHIYKISL